MGTTDIGNNTEFRSGRIAIRSGCDAPSEPRIACYSSTVASDVQVLKSLCFRACGKSGRMRWVAPSPTRVALPWVLAAVLSTGALGCASANTGENPDRVLSAYSSALREGRAADAYALLSDDAKKSIPSNPSRRFFAITLMRCVSSRSRSTGAPDRLE